MRTQCASGVWRYSIAHGSSRRPPRRYSAPVEWISTSLAATRARRSASPRSTVRTCVTCGANRAMPAAITLAKSSNQETAATRASGAVEASATRVASFGISVMATVGTSGKRAAIAGKRVRGSTTRSAGGGPARASSTLTDTTASPGFSVPTFWIGMLLIMAFAVELGWLPSGGRGEVAEFAWLRTSLATADGWSHVILPAINLSLFKMGLLIRLTRAGMVEAMGTEYVKFARAQGLPDRQIVFGHVLRNISIPIVTVFGLELGSTLAFAVVTESVFDWPGVGKLIIDSILQLDRPVMVSYLVRVVVLFVVINLVVDLARARLDPRVRLRGGA